MSDAVRTDAEAVSAMTQDDFKEFYASITTPVAIVTAYGPDRAPYGTTIGSYCSISLDPPIVVISLLPSSDLLSVLSHQSSVRVHFPGRDDVELARRFAGKGGPLKFNDIQWSSKSAAPTLDNLPWLLGHVDEIRAVGDHFMVHVEATEVNYQNTDPLLYRARAFGSFQEESA